MAIFRSTPLLLLLPATAAFQATVRPLSTATPSTTHLFASTDKDAPATSVTVETVLKDNYPEFHSLLSKNENIFDQLENDFDSYTLFAPNSNAFQNLGEKKLQQIEDPRNLETAQKMGLYHVIDERLSFTDLNREDWTVPKTPEGLPALKYRALRTMGGEVPMGRYKQTMDGGFFRGLLGKDKKVVKDEAGNAKTDIIVGPEGKILRSVKVGKATIHEVEGLVSPNILWRYCDQLRIPGF